MGITAEQKYQLDLQDAKEAGAEMGARLSLALIEAGRMDDLKRALSDVACRAELYAEFGIE